jgi:hypothetical protein
VLERIVKYYHLWRAGTYKVAYALHTVLTYRYVNIRKAGKYLARLVTYLTTVGKGPGQDITVGASAVTAA